MHKHSFTHSTKPGTCFFEEMDTVARFCGIQFSSGSEGLHSLNVFLKFVFYHFSFFPFSVLKIRMEVSVRANSVRYLFSGVPLL